MQIYKLNMVPSLFFLSLFNLVLEKNYSRLLGSFLASSYLSTFNIIRVLFDIYTIKISNFLI